MGASEHRASSTEHRAPNTSVISLNRRCYRLWSLKLEYVLMLGRSSYNHVSMPFFVLGAFSILRCVGMTGLDIIAGSEAVSQPQSPDPGYLLAEPFINIAVIWGYSIKDNNQRHMRIGFPGIMGMKLRPRPISKPLGHFFHPSLSFISTKRITECG